jgi:hypothetical protein
MADASSVEAKLDGVNPTNQQPWPYRVVDLLAEYQGPGAYFPPEAPNNTASLFDQIVTLCKIVARRKDGKDIFDLTVENNTMLAAIKAKLGA